MAFVNPEFWHNKRVFITGHTGFKGSWLSLWLQSMGAEVKGYALSPPTTPSLYWEAQIASGIHSEIGDIRDLDKITNSMVDFDPDILIHMAAQPLVRESYKEPVETYSTNVIGTVNVLEAARRCPSIRVIVNVTTDKCYENKEWVWGYREEDPMGGHDPYSSSKGCAELVTAAYRNSFFSGLSNVALASVRAGNVIGGGDWAVDRLIPDILRAFEVNIPVVIRNPGATRPWQHVLEPLSGYLVLAQRLWDDKEKYSEAWNFGPRDDDVKPVEWIMEHMVDYWGEGASWTLDDKPQLHEARLLKLDISKARSRLNWTPTWSLDTALKKIVSWHRAWLYGSDVRQQCMDEIEEYVSDMNND